MLVNKIKTSKKIAFLFLVISLFLLVNINKTYAAVNFHTPDNPGSSKITITTANTGNNLAKASGVVGNFLKGGYVPETGQFYITGSYEGTVTNGQKVEIFIPTGNEQGTFIVEVVTVKKASKPTPTTKPKPQQKPTTKPKQTPTKKPTQPSKNNSTNTSKSNSNKPISKKPTKITVSKTAQKENLKENKKKPKDARKTNDYKVKYYSIEELKKLHAEVQKNEGHFFAIVRDKNIKQEITREEAIKLGYKDDTQNEVAKQTDPINKSQIVTNNDNNNDKKEKTIKPEEVKSSKPLNMQLITGGVVILAVITFGSLFIFHPRFKDILTRITSKFKK